MAKDAPSTSNNDKSTVSMSTDACSPSVRPSHTTSASAAQPAITAVRRAMEKPNGSSAASGRARSNRNSVPPSAIDWLRITRPWRMISR
jgi:hypothetical protein